MESRREDAPPSLWESWRELGGNYSDNEEDCDDHQDCMEGEGDESRREVEENAIISEVEELPPPELSSPSSYLEGRRCCQESSDVMPWRMLKGGRRKRWEWGDNLLLMSAALFLVILSCSMVTGEMMPEDDFDSSNKKVKFEDFDTNVTPIQASGGGAGVTSSTRIPGDKETRAVASLGFLHAFIASFSVIVVSELGDKTFFIAAIMAMRHSRLTVFAGAMSALALMTVLSALFGYATTIIPKAITYYVSTALFAIFGLKMLYDGYRMSPDEGAEELEEVQQTLRRRDDDNNDIESQTSKDSSPPVSQGYRLPTALRRILFTCFSRIYLQALTMTFLAEWGDRSQIATIILAAREDVPGVCLGGVLGHSCCTGLAVLGGRMIAQKISVRTVTIIGGVVFLMFALTSLFISPD